LSFNLYPLIDRFGGANDRKPPFGQIFTFRLRLAARRAVKTPVATGARFADVFWGVGFWRWAKFDGAPHRERGPVLGI
jgi:hypothetical protein